MKLVSNFAVAAMVLLGVTAVAAVPAQAQKSKKDAPDGEKPLAVSKDFGKPAMAIGAAIQAKDYATAEAQYAVAEPLAKTDDERYYLSIYKLQIAGAKKDAAGMAAALDALIANPRTPSAELANYYNLRGGVTVDMGQNAEAIPFLLKARELGKGGPDLQVSLAKAYGATGKTRESIAELDKAIAMETAAGRVAPEPWYGYVVSNLYALGDVPAAEAALAQQLKAYPKVATWRSAVENYRKVTDPNMTRFTKAQKLQLFRMMRATKALASPNDYYVYANSALDSGLPWETVAVIDAGKAAGRVPAGDPDITRIYKAGGDSVATGGSIASFDAQAGTSGAKANEAADINLAAGNYDKAAQFYGMALSKGGIDANLATMNLGVALANLGRKDEAKAAFAKVTGAPLADIARLWTIWLDAPPLA